MKYIVLGLVGLCIAGPIGLMLGLILAAVGGKKKTC